MTTTTPTRPRQFDVDAEIRHVRDLLALRALLAARGATPAELEDYDAAISGARTRLADVTRAASAALAA